MYYQKPLQLSRLISGEFPKRVSLGESISQNIELIIFTRNKEHRPYNDFGCLIWDLDFELVVREGIWKEKFRRSLLGSVTKSENRLYNLEIEVNMTDVEERFFPKDNPELKKRVEIFVRGNIKASGEKYFFSNALYLSPLCG